MKVSATYHLNIYFATNVMRYFVFQCLFMTRNANIKDGMLTKIAIKQLIYVTLDSNAFGTNRESSKGPKNYNLLKNLSEIFLFRFTILKEIKVCYY